MRRRAILHAGVASGLSLTGVTSLSGSPADSSAAASVRDDRHYRNLNGDAHAPLGRVTVPGAADVGEAVVGDDGETAYLATYTGFATVDVSNPADPTVLAERSDLLSDLEVGRFTQILDLAVDGDRLVVVGPGNRTSSDVFQGAVVYDVRDPADPVRVGDPYETDFHIHNCFLDGERCYLVDNDGERNALVIVDLSEPREVGRWSLLADDDRWADVDPILWYLHDVFVHDDVAYLPYWNAGTYFVDVSDPTDPQYLGHVPGLDVETQRELSASAVTDAQQTLPGNHHYSTVDETGDLLGIGKEAWATEEGDPEGAGGIDLYDVSDLSSPVHLSTIEPPETPDASHSSGMWTTAHNFELRDGRLHSSWYRGGVKVHDVTDPSSPVERGHWRDDETAAFWTARVGRPGEFSVASSTGMIPNTPTEAALYTFPIGADGADGEDADTGSDSNSTDEDGDGDSGDDAGARTQNESASASSDGEIGDRNESGDGDEDDADGLPGFAGVATLASGVCTLEWLRRRSGATRRADDS